MQKTKLIAQLIPGAMLLLALVTLGQQVVQGQQRERIRTSSLVRTVCVGSGPGRFRYDETNIAIARAVYRSLMNLNPSNGSASVTCRIRDEDEQAKFKTLELGLGMLDTDAGSPANIVNIYLDGRQAATRTVGAGQTASFSFDVTNVSNVAIEATCSTSARYCARVYVYKAVLERIPEVRRPRLRRN
ncbi:hypothetical protein [Microseira wollei]|uniref:DUF11 domain-containing protein n=1 Tax=Microseira wollei NIES-4236 TaxID=2530354 RepID=A0AAV3X4U2_9CYAN|nr:hypothetical protein [Microseira wollei]GET36328.1 hypothetical protein MiSe_10760 [Microseira wollei NIES-4236]